MVNPIRLVDAAAAAAPAALTPAQSGAALREQAYTEIKRRIIACEFRPGEPLNEAQVATLLGLGRTPVHQALHRLEVEGLVSILPRKGVLVTPLSLNEVLDMIEVRATNEVLCATLACERGHDSDFKAMREIVDRSPDLIACRDIPALASLDLKFHTAMSAASRNRVLAELLRGLHEKQARFWFLSLSDPQHLENVYQEHLEIHRRAGTARRARAARGRARTHRRIPEEHHPDALTEFFPS